MISVELVDVRNNKLLWGEHYDRKMADLLATQREIATTIAQKLELKLSGDDSKGITKRYTNSNEAYQLYLKGRYHWNKRTEEGFKKSIQHFEEAIARDPGYALAWAGLADAYHQLGIWGNLPPRDACPKAEAAAKRALECDPNLAEAHASLGTIKREFTFELAGAERGDAPNPMIPANLASVFPRLADGTAVTPNVGLLARKAARPSGVNGSSCSGFPSAG